MWQSDPQHIQYTTMMKIYLWAFAGKWFSCCFELSTVILNSKPCIISDLTQSQRNISIRHGPYTITRNIIKSCPADELMNGVSIDGLPVCVLSYIFAWHRGSSGQPPWVRLLHSLGHCHLARLCKIYSAQRYETVNGLATNVPLHYPELNWSGCLYDLNFGIKNELNKI